MNEVTIRNINMSFNFNKFVKDFTEISILFIINYFSKYNNFFSHEKLRNIIAIITSLELLR